MHTTFQIQALDQAQFAPLFHFDDAQLAARNIVRMIVDKKPAFPCRVSLQDAEIGEEVLLLPYQHLSMPSPYQSGGAIFVRKKAETARLQPNEIPLMLTHRLLSVRAYDGQGMMKKAVVTEGAELRSAIHDLFDAPEIDFLHIHNAKPGCFNCAVRSV